MGTHGRWTVRKPPSFATTIRLAPGQHRVGINCLSFEILGHPPETPVIFPTAKAQFVLVTGSFEAGKTYYTRCVAPDGQPRAWLVDVPNGADLPPGFTSICTRGCPR